MNDVQSVLTKVKEICVELASFTQKHGPGVQARSKGRTKGKSYLSESYIQDFEALCIMLIDLGRLNGTVLFTHLVFLHLAKRRYTLPTITSNIASKVFATINLPDIKAFEDVIENDNAVQAFDDLVKPDVTESEILLFRLSH